MYSVEREEEGIEEKEEQEDKTEDLEKQNKSYCSADFTHFLFLHRS